MNRRPVVAFGIILTLFASMAAAQVPEADPLGDVRTMSDLDHFRTDALPGIANLEIKRTVARQLAGIYRSARDLVVARELYGMAYELSGGADMDSLMDVALTEFELGEVKSADTTARMVLARTSDYSLKRRAYTLIARCAFAEDRVELARQMLETLAELATDDDVGRSSVEVESLLLLYEVQTAMGDAGAAETIALRINSLFPDSLAAEFTGTGSRLIAQAALPGSIALSGVLGPGAERFGVSPIDRTRMDEPRFSGVQVGSFSDSDNALHLTADLRKLGLDARTDTVSREGSTLYQVVISIPDGSTEEAAVVFATLTDNGYAGFLVY